MLQLLLDVLNFSAASFSALTHTYSLEVVLMDVVVNSIQEHLDLIKYSLEHIKVLLSHICLLQ